VPSAERTVTIRRPAREVFAYLADGTNDPQWRSGVLEIERTSDADGVGAVYRQVLAGPGGRRIAGDYRVTVFDPPRRFEFQVIAGPARPKGSFELTPRGDDATDVRFALDVRPRGLTLLLTPMIAAQMRKEVAALDRAKRVLEAEA
jgi:uncharacterized protein YndB with AHSA1/START domain